MDFRSQAAGADGAIGVAADAVLAVMVGDKLPSGLPAALSKALVQAQKEGDFTCKPGSHLLLYRQPGLGNPRVAVVHAAAGARGLRSAVGTAYGMVKGSGVKHVAVQVFGAGADMAAPMQEVVQAVVAALGDATYAYRHTKPSAPKPSVLAKATLVVAGKADAVAAEAALKTARAVASGVGLTREVANRPANHCTPRHLAHEARALAKSHGLKVQVLERKDCEKLGMGSFLAVAQGSDEPPQFIVLQFQGAAKTDAPVVLVGKGITFDTGGISIKPAAGMDEMKFDMGGAASVLGTMRAVAELKPKINVVGLIPTCENMPSGRAVKPGDVVTSMSGQTIEILNTDAEGRLILCDALTYAERFKPAAVVDIATLTGACVIALGHHRTGLFTPDDGLAQALSAAGESALDPCWRMPTDEEYDEALKSNFADMANVGPREGGAINAAMFLKRFTAKLRWAHLDIAGTAWKSGAAKGATGRPVGLLTHFILGQVGAKAAK